MRIKSKELIALLLILLFGLWVRFTGSDALLPQRQAPDTYIVNQALLLKKGGSELLESNRILDCKYPQLMAQLLRFLLPDDFNRTDRTPTFGPSNESILKSHLYQASAPYLCARTLVILISILLVPGTWLLARRFMGPLPALFAAALVAASLLHAVYSKQARPHAPEATFILLALLSYLKLMQDSRLRVLILSGVTTGLAICCLQNGFFCLPALFAAFHFNHKSDGGKLSLKLSVLILIIGTCLFCFYSFNFRGNFKVSGLQYGILNFHDTCFKDICIHLFLYDPVLAGLTILGALYLIPKIRRSFSLEQNRELMVILAFVLPYSLIIGLYGENQIRYLLPLIPMLAALGALGIEKMVSLIFSDQKKARQALVVSFILLLSLPAYATGRLAILHARPDTLTLAAQWFNKNADYKKTHILTGEGIQIPLFYLKPSPWAFWVSPWSHYQNRINTRIPGLQKWPIYPLVDRKTDYYDVKFNTDLVAKILRDHKKKYIVMKMGSPTAEQALRPRENIVLKPVARFDIFNGSNKLGYNYCNGYQDKYMLNRVLMGKAWGPPIEIYELSLDRAGAK